MRVLLIDDHALVRKGLEQLLVSRGVEVVASVGNGEEGVARAVALKPTVILLDLNMPGMGGLETLEKLRTSGVSAPIVMLTISDDDADLHAVLRAGANGYLLKGMDPDGLLPAIEAACHGTIVTPKDMNKYPGQPVPFPGLTPRESEILHYLARGESNKEIARALGIYDGTVKQHVKAILPKLGVGSRAKAGAKARERGYGCDVANG